ncbi:uroporphyrinogen-III synthase [Listeria aquatica]|uniref:uroporphyrinogen-III synthase n=1 Tax=Listeria aquatica TaxID=1494960 RepID=UPI003F712145
MTDAVFLTREKSKNQASLLRLQAAGMKAISIPMIEVKPLTFEWTEKVLQVDWIFFTSQNSVRFFLQNVRQLPTNIKVASIGEKTSEALENWGISVDFEPSLYETEVFLKEWSQKNAAETNAVLLPQSKIAKPRIPQFLTSLGISCFRLPLYDTVLPSEALTNLKSALASYPHFIAVFASPSAWRNFKQILDDLAFHKPFFIGSIGEVTTQAIEKDDYEVTFQPEKYQMENLIDLIIKESKNDDKKL